MARLQQKSRHTLTVIVVLVAISAACRSSSILTAPTEPPVPLDKATEPANLAEGAPLAPGGPWWLFLARDDKLKQALWAVNPDGSGLTQLTDNHVLGPANLGGTVSPNGGHIAYMSTVDNKFRDLVLWLITLPDGTVRRVTELSTPEIDAATDSDADLRPPEPALAIVTADNLAWSPDGQNLAFVGAQQGPSSDLYVYSLEDGSVTRLTDGPSQDIRPVWSPDGNYIVHMGVETVGTGAGFSMAGAWAARADGSEVRSIFEPIELGDEVVLSWMHNDTLLVYSRDAIRGGTLNLRTVSIETGQIRRLWSSFFTDVALNPDTGSLLIAVDSDTAQQNPDRLQGLFFIDPEVGVPFRLTEEEASKVIWSDEAELLFALTEFGVLAVSSGGDVLDLSPPQPGAGLPVAAQGSKDLAWTVSGLWIGPLLSSIETPPRQIFSEDVLVASWSPDGQHLLFYTRDAVYAASNPEFSPVLVADGLRLSARSAAWVLP